MSKALFLEESYEDRTFVLYTLKDVDHQGYPSLYRKYLEMADPAEVYFSRVYFDGWEHWQIVCEASWFKPYITRWRQELELQIRSDALTRIMEVAKADGHKASYDANKFLVSAGWKDKPQTKDGVGRPTKEAIKKQAEAMFLSQQDTTEDLKRIQ